MNQFARELFARLLAVAPHVYMPESSSFRERTDEELDALVKYALRAEAACAREEAREHARRVANPPPRPPPTGVPPGGYQPLMPGGFAGGSPRPPTSPTTLPPPTRFRRILAALALALALALTGCGPEYHWTDRCDADRQERVFLECLRTAQHMGSNTAPGNDSDEVIDSCGAEARAVACERVFACFARCSEVTP